MQIYNRADRNRRARGIHARINRVGSAPTWRAWPGFGPQRRRDGSVIPRPEATKFREACARRGRA